MTVAVLMTCYNRRETTLQCLQSLVSCAPPKDLSLDLWINDDRSTDGTGDAVQNWYRTNSTVVPFVSHLYLIQGSGHDYWCGGMRRVWRAAAKEVKYDGFLWLNDDTFLNEKGLMLLLDDNKEKPELSTNIIVGAISSRDGQTTTYGGEDKDGSVVPDGTWHSLLQMNGNAVWIPRLVYERLGNLDMYWTHAWGDADYSRKAVRKGIGVWLTPAFVGTCDKSPKLVAWRDPKVPLIDRLKNLYSPLGYAEPPLMFRFCCRYDGVMNALLTLIRNHLTALFPKERNACDC